MKLLVVYASLTGTARSLAYDASEILTAKVASVTVDTVSAENLDPEDLATQSFVLFVFSTHSAGKPPKSAAFFLEWLQEAADDFRVGQDFLKGVRYAVFGVGHSAYEGDFNASAKALDKAMARHSAKRLTPICLGDVASGDIKTQLKLWADKVVAKLEKNSLVSEERKENKEEGVVDMEDLGDMLGNKEDEESKEIKDMVTPQVRESLTKQGYKVIGSHSGVKLCRWTKAMLRGRGGCYKHTFYGISSFQCMEMTPSLACANKCVFCWRHHSNPVGTSWKWKMDDADYIVDQAIDQHKKMIKQMKGVPGVLPERYEQAMNVQHCALSLVGEPIMYPEINKLVGILHGQQISTFLVTNAQFPDAIDHLDPVTQLYVSIDASTKDSLNAVDRPLFKDFWERFLDSLRAIGRKKQRTVYRLTLVKGYNMEELQQYAELIALGNPEFIEVKGVTYCGNSDASDLTMSNVPYHQEVRDFCIALCQVLGQDVYDLACEHVHSCCILIAHRKFYVEGQWHTWINYPKFQELVQSGRRDFSSLEYMAPTPEWAVFGDHREGFDPQETRFRRKAKGASAVEVES